jgi:hypothetical protein
MKDMCELFSALTVFTCVLCAHQNPSDTFLQLAIHAIDG